VLIWAIPWIFLCMGTVYLLPHYAVDAIAGFFSAIVVFFLLKYIWNKIQ
jgi:membrane-associated phospholipid phosphatase